VVDLEKTILIAVVVNTIHSSISVVASKVVIPVRIPIIHIACPRLSNYSSPVLYGPLFVGPFLVGPLLRNPLTLVGPFLVGAFLAASLFVAQFL